MEDRQKKILKAVVKEHQRTGQLVSSQGLVERYHFDFSPATVRAEMLTLDEADFLEQPHTSAGRLPTDKAYRFFIDEFFDDEISDNEKEQVCRKVEKLQQESLQEMAQFLADCTKNLGISGSFGRPAQRGEGQAKLGRATDFHEAGLRWLAEEPEFEQGEFKDILRYFDSLEEDFNNFFHDIDEETEIFIGHENPIKYLQNFSLLITGLEIEDEKKILGILGPKRMNYQRNKFVLEETKKKLRNTK